MKLTVTVDGTLVRQGLQNLAKEVPEIGRRKIYDMVNRITRNMEGYPAERPNQTYVRTGRFGRSWKVSSLENGYQISNTAESRGRAYPKYVVGDAYGTGQAWMHRGRWQVFRDVVDQEVAKMPQEIANAVQMVARRAGFEVK